MSLSSPRLPQPLRTSIALLVASLAAPLVFPAVQAAPLTWDTDSVTAAAQDGSGTWNTTNTNWLSGSTTGLWSDGSDATFGGGTDGAYSIMVALNPSATSLIFNNSGYSLSAAAPQTITVTNTTSSIVLAAGKTATIGNNVTVATPAISANSAVTGAGTLIIDSGGTLKNAGTASTNILSINSSTVEVKTGGSLLSTPISGGNGNAIFINGTLNVTGGNVSAVGTFGIGQATTTGTVTVSSGTLTASSTNGIRIGSTSGTTPGGTLNLDGGTVNASKIFKGATGTTASVMNFNGGKLQANSGANTDTANFLTGLGRANVRNGGAIIDTNTKNITIGQLLDHSNIGGDNATDGGLTKLGTGTLTLTAANAYNGGTTISGGALQFGAVALPTTGNITVNSAGALNVAGPLTTVTDWLASGRIATGSTGALALMGDSTENISLGSYGSLMIGASANSNYSGALTPAGTTYHLGGGGATLTLSGVNAITGARDLVVGASGSTGTVVLGSSNDYTGGTTLNAGTLSVANDANLGAATGALNFNGGTLNVTGAGFTSTTRTINWGANGGSFDIASNITFSLNQTLASGGGLTKAGAGTLILLGNNGIGGASTITGGILCLASPTALGTSSLTGNSTATQVQLSSNVTLNNSIRLVGAGLNNDGTLKNLDGNNTLTDFGISGAGGTRINVAGGSTLNLPNGMSLMAGTGAQQNIRVIGTGTLVLGGSTTAVIGAANSFLIGTGPGAGPTIKAGHDQAFGAGTIDFQAGANATVASADGTAHAFSNALKFSDTVLNQVTFGAAGSGNLTFSGSTSLSGNLSASIQNTTTTISGAISGSASLTKVGPGTLVLGGSNANTFSAGVFVNAGTLDVQKAGGLGSGDVSVTSGATLTLELAAGNNYISDSGKLLLAVGSPVVNLNFTGTPDTVAALSFDGGATFAAAGTWGSPTSGAQFTSNVFVGTGTIQVVPEPGSSTVLLACAGLLGLRRRRRG